MGSFRLLLSASIRRPKGGAGAAGPARYATVSDVEQWQKSASQGDKEVMAARIDMILQHDLHDHLPLIDTPTLVLVRSADACTPPHL